MITDTDKGAFLLFQTHTFALFLRKLFSVLSSPLSKLFLFLMDLEESMQSMEDVNFYVNYLL